MVEKYTGRLVGLGEPRVVSIRNGFITAMEPTSDRPDLPWISPPLFDVQINGCKGHAFHEALTLEDYHAICDTIHAHGIGAFCPTLITNSYDNLRQGFTALSRACQQSTALAEAMPVYHLEGPYISPEDGPRGAHPKQHVRPSSYEEFQRLQEAANGNIRLITLAPEQPGAETFIRQVTQEGVVVALGHTAASREQIHRAIGAGARLSTHLGNGSHAILPRHDNYIWEQLAADGLQASLIPDGHHLSASVVKCMIRAKEPRRCILTCDASSLAGSPPGRYVEWEQDLEVLPGGKVVLAGTPYLAGSGVFTDTCVDFVLRHTDVSLHEVLHMAGHHPRHLLGLPAQRMEVGARADFILFDYQPGESFTVRATILGGRGIS